MEFKKEHADSFEAVFNDRKAFILAFEGCSFVELRRPVNEPCIFFTISHWDSTISLEKYRNSDRFRATWKEVKPWFSAKPLAWSLEEA